MLISMAPAAAPMKLRPWTLTNSLMLVNSCLLSWCTLALTMNLKTYTVSLHLSSWDQSDLPPRTRNYSSPTTFIFTLLGMFHLEWMWMNTISPIILHSIIIHNDRDGFSIDILQIYINSKTGISHLQTFFLSDYCLSLMLSLSIWPNPCRNANFTGDRKMYLNPFCVSLSRLMFIQSSPSVCLLTEAISSC